MGKLSEDLTGQNGCAKVSGVLIDFMINLLNRVVAVPPSASANDYSITISGESQ